MRLADVIGVLAALVVGGLVAILLLASVIGEPATLPTPAPPTLGPLGSLFPGASGSAAPLPATPLPSPGQVAIGQPAPRMVLTLIDGSLFDTADYAGQPLWIDFMATWCPQCATELPLMHDYQDELGDEATIVLVDVGQDRQTVKQFLDGLGVGLPAAVDSDSAVQREWGAFALPVHYFVGADGIVHQVVYGGAPQEIFDQALGTIIAAPSPSPAGS